MRLGIPSIPRYIRMPRWTARLFQIAFLVVMLLAGLGSAITLYAFASAALEIG